MDGLTPPILPTFALALALWGASTVPAGAACQWSQGNGLPGIVCQPGPARLTPPAPPLNLAPTPTPYPSPSEPTSLFPEVPTPPPVAGTPAPPLGPPSLQPTITAPSSPPSLAPAPPVGALHPPGGGGPPSLNRGR